MSALWHLLAGALTLEEQARLFDFIDKHDATDWGKLAPCMNPTPKTLEFSQQQGAQSTRLLSFSPEDKAVVVELVIKALGILQWRKAIKSLTRCCHPILRQRKPPVCW